MIIRVSGGNYRHRIVLIVDLGGSMVLKFSDVFFFFPLRKRELLFSVISNGPGAEAGLIANLTPLFVVFL